MNREEVKMMLRVLSVAYPSTYKNMTKEDASAHLALYESQFHDDSSDVVSAALNYYISKNEYPPTPAGIRKCINLVFGKNDFKSACDEAWKAVCGDIRFEQLSDINKMYFKNQNAIDQIGFSNDTIEGVFRGQYMKEINMIAEAMDAKESAMKTIGSERLHELTEERNIKALVSSI